MYIKYTFVHFVILLICQVLGAVPLLVTISLIVEALSFRLGSSFGLLPGSGNLLAILLEVPLLSLAFFLETSGLVNHQYLMLLDPPSREWQLAYHYPSLAYYSSSRSLCSLVVVIEELCQ